MNAQQIADRIVNKAGSYQDVVNYAEGMISPLIQRAEAAEARAAQAEAERDDLRVELDTVNMLRTGSEAACDELRRQLTEAQHAIGVLSNTVVAQDATIKRLSQAREDVAEYRAEIARLNQAATA